MEYISIAQKKIDEIDSLHKIALTKLEEIKKEKADAGTAATSTVTLAHNTDHKKMLADEGELWKGAHEVSVRAYNEVKSMIMLYKQPNS